MAWNSVASRGIDSGILNAARTTPESAEPKRACCWLFTAMCNCVPAP
jgi:hypothetical protein